MADKNVGTFCLFLLLSITAHTSFIYSVYRPAVAAQSLAKPVEVSLIAEKPSAMTDVVSVADEHALNMTAVNASSVSTPVELNPDVAIEPSDGMQSDFVEQSDVVMLPILRVNELLADRIAKAGFTESEFVEPVSSDPRYRTAVEVHRRVRAQQNLKPIYPKEAYDANLSGRVIAELLINAEGALDEILIIAATRGFERSARDSLQDITFYPAEIDGKKVASRMLIEMKYLLVKKTPKRASEENVMPIGTFDAADKK